MSNQRKEHVGSIEWYQDESRKRKCSPYCPIAAHDKCPRYHLSMLLVENAGLDDLNLTPQMREKLHVMWEGSAVYANPDYGVAVSWPAAAKGMMGFDNFCPEVVYRYEEIFASDLRPVLDDESRVDGRWRYVKARHYAGCLEYSVYTSQADRKKASSRRKILKQDIGDALRWDVFRKSHFKCYWCGRSPGADNIRLQVDHVLPRAEGGADDPENLVASCERCNRGKGKKLVLEAD